MHPVIIRRPLKTIRYELRVARRKSCKINKKKLLEFAINYVHENTAFRQNTDQNKFIIFQCDERVLVRKSNTRLDEKNCSNYQTRGWRSTYLM